MELHVLTFSPTGSSRKVAIEIAKGISDSNINISDITYKEPEKLNFHAHQLTIVSVPVYGGHVAPTAMQRLKSIQGNNTPTVAVVVYGNRHYEHALEELASFLTEKGFRIIAAGTFIGEHSYSTEQTPIAIGRPDNQDMLVAKQFGREIAAKIHKDSDNTIIDVRTIEQAEKDDQTMMIFRQTVMTWMKSGVQMPTSPKVNASLCNECGICASLCPTSAISKKLPQTSDTNKCIKCCACVKGCPRHARTFTTPFAQLLADNFSKRKENKYLI